MSTTHGTHWLEREDLGALTVVRLKTPKSLDEDIIRTVFDLLCKLVEVGRTQVVLNLGAAEFLPSMGLGKLVMLNRKLQAAKGRLALCEVAPAIWEALEHTRLLSLFNIFPTEAEATASFGSGPT